MGPVKKQAKYIDFLQYHKIFVLKNEAFLCVHCFHTRIIKVFCNLLGNIFTNEIMSDTDAQSAEAELVISSIGESKKNYLVQLHR